MSCAHHNKLITTIHSHPAVRTIQFAHDIEFVQDGFVRPVVHVGFVDDLDGPFGARFLVGAEVNFAKAARPEHVANGVFLQEFADLFCDEALGIEFDGLALFDLVVAGAIIGAILRVARHAEDGLFLNRSSHSDAATATATAAVTDRGAYANILSCFGWLRSRERWPIIDSQYCMQLPVQILLVNAVRIKVLLWQ